jgi:hypothetical protein
VSVVAEDDLTLLDMNHVLLLLWIDSPEHGGGVHVHYPASVSRHDVVEVLKMVTERVEMDVAADEAVTGEEG